MYIELHIQYIYETTYTKLHIQNYIYKYKTTYTKLHIQIYIQKMNITTALVLCMLLLIFISIGFMITETYYRIAYFGVVALLFLSALNIYLSVVYYVQLRNDPGVIGIQGEKGPTGVKGVSGKCSFSEKCGIPNARKIVLDIANTMYDIPKQCLDKPTLDNCNKSQDMLEQAMPINTQIDMLEKIAYSSTMSEADFKNKLNVCLQDSNGCMDPTDF